MIRNITDYLERSANLYPDKLAFVDENKSLTFSQLRENAKRVASGLIRAGATKKPVAVCMEKTVDAITVFMGVVYAGGYYTPVDVSMPEKRIEIILNTLNSGLIVVDEEGKKKIDNLGNNETIIFDNLIKNDIDEKEIDLVKRKIIDCDPVYIIFTSGSTGVPKGVVISHRTVVDLAEWLGETFEFDENTIFGNQTPFYFDASVKDIYSTLRNSSTMYIIPTQLFGFPNQLFQFLNNNKINTIMWATSAICLVANEKSFESECPRYLEKIFFAGEAMPIKQLNFWKNKIPNAQYINLYGPTEAGVDSSYYIVDREFDETESLPIGEACRNMDILILNGDEPVKTNEVGEICIRGTALANGYYGNWDKTNSVFVQNPLQKNYNDMIYRSGDLGYFNDEGLIMFASRKDDQVKHMGYRIELGEIETALNSIESISQCACLFDKIKDQIICVYTGDIYRREIILELNKMIPKYMWPNKFIKLDQMPMNLNGKIDRPLLKESYLNKND